MRAINHALTGTLLGLTIGEPVIALPVSLASHFICDLIPHHGIQHNLDQALRSKLFRNTLFADALLCGLLVLFLALWQPLNWQLASLCAFFAASPDLLFINRYLKAKTHQLWQPSRLVKWTIDIQWFQRPIGAVVEVIWFAGALTLLLPFLINK